MQPRRASRTEPLFGCSPRQKANNNNKEQTTTYKQVEALAGWLETAKMRPSLAGNLLGGPLLADAVARLEAAAVAGAGARGGSSYYRLLLVSAHYNTQLAVLAALGLGGTGDDDGDSGGEGAPGTAASAGGLPWVGRIPAPNSVLAFELHRGGGGGGASDGGGVLAVRLVAQDGPLAEYRTVPLPRCAGAGGGVLGAAAERVAGRGACELRAFVAAYGGAAIGDAGGWCRACGNTAMAACVAAAASRGNGGVPAGAGWRIAVAAVASAAGAALLAVGACALLARRGNSGGWGQQRQGSGALDAKLNALEAGSSGSSGGDGRGGDAAGALEAGGRLRI